MKTSALDLLSFRTIFFIGLLLMANVCNSQHYESMLKQSGTWHVTFCTENTCFTDFYSSAEDTVIDSKRYRFLVDFHFNKAVVVREDTINGKVYFRYLYGQRKHTDVLMYDYSLELNDTINIFNPNSPIPEDSLGLYDVVKVDSILTEKGYRKRLKLDRHDKSSNEFLSTTWVEGIGGLSYINTPAAGPDLYGFGELSCFAFNGNDNVYKSEFSKEQGTCKIKISPTEETNSVFNKTSKEVGIYPNPTTDHLNIHGVVESKISVQIQSYLGRTVFESRGVSNKMDITQLEPGCYFVRVFEGDKLIHQQRLIKQ